MAMEQFALLVTALVLCLTAFAVVAQLLRWRETHRGDRRRWGRAVHEDPKWKAWVGRGDSGQR